MTSVYLQCKKFNFGPDFLKNYRVLDSEILYIKSAQNYLSKKISLDIIFEGEKNGAKAYGQL